MARENIWRVSSRGPEECAPWSRFSGPDLSPPMPAIVISEIDVLALVEKGDLPRLTLPRRNPAPTPTSSEALAVASTGSSTLGASVSAPADLRADSEAPPS